MSIDLFYFFAPIAHAMTSFACALNKEHSVICRK